jgi:hypothetical protein
VHIEIEIDGDFTAQGMLETADVREGCFSGTAPWHVSTNSKLVYCNMRRLIGLGERQNRRYVMGSYRRRKIVMSEIVSQ